MLWIILRIAIKQFFYKKQFYFVTRNIEKKLLQQLECNDTENTEPYLNYNKSHHNMITPKR